MARIEEAKRREEVVGIPDSVWTLVDGIRDRLVECECVANSIHHSLLGSPLVQTGAEPGDSMQDVLSNIRGRLADLREQLNYLHSVIGTV
jgi:hypothetical protein